MKELLLTPDYFCGKLLGLCEDVGTFEDIDPYLDAQKIISGKPEEARGNDFIDKLYASIKGKQRKTFRVVHVSDFHADPWYVEGAIANCAGRYCCRNDS